MLRARPRSIPGLLWRLAQLYARRWLVGALVVAVLTVAVALALGLVGRAAEPRAAGDLQAGVLRDGFVVSRAVDAGYRVVELDPEGREERAFAVARGGDVRAVGARSGSLIAWQDGDKVRLGRPDGSNDRAWGKSVRQLCDGVASNDARFGVGWLEANDSVWIVHGPLAADADSADAETSEALAVAAPLARNEWCGVASAGQNIALLWRAGDSLSLVMCNKKRCGGLEGHLKVPRNQPILGVGCIRDACLIATRDAAGQARIGFITSTGRLKWTKPLAATSATIAVVGYADRAFAVGYTGERGAEVLRFDTTGASTQLWRDPAATAAPALAWSSGRLLVAHRHGNAIANDVVPAP